VLNIVRGGATEQATIVEIAPDLVEALQRGFDERGFFSIAEYSHGASDVVEIAQQ